jgi:hypothetical protein
MPKQTKDSMHEPWHITNSAGKSKQCKEYQIQHTKGLTAPIAPPSDKRSIKPGMIFAKSCSINWPFKPVVKQPVTCSHSSPTCNTTYQL